VRHLKRERRQRQQVRGAKQHLRYDLTTPPARAGVRSTGSSIASLRTMIEISSVLITTAMAGCQTRRRIKKCAAGSRSAANPSASVLLGNKCHRARRRRRPRRPRSHPRARRASTFPSAPICRPARKPQPAWPHNRPRVAAGEHQSVGPLDRDIDGARKRRVILDKPEQHRCLRRSMLR